MLLCVCVCVCVCVWWGLISYDELRSGLVFNCGEPNRWSSTDRGMRIRALLSLAMTKECFAVVSSARQLCIDPHTEWTVIDSIHQSKIEGFCSYVFFCFNESSLLRKFIRMRWVALLFVCHGYCAQKLKKVIDLLSDCITYMAFFLFALPLIFIRTFW